MTGLLKSKILKKLETDFSRPVIVTGSRNLQQCKYIIELLK